MSTGRHPAAWIVPGLTIAVWLAAEVLLFVPAAGAPDAPGYYAVYGIPYVAFAAVGGLIVRAAQAGRVGWALGGIGLLQGISVLVAEVVRLAAANGGRTGAAWVLLLLSPVPIAAMALLVVLLLVFPDGRLPSPRWRWFLAGVGVLAGAALVSQVTDPRPPQGVPGLPPSPLADRAVFDAVAPLASFWLFAVAVLAAAFSLVLRYRAGGPVIRSQLKWLALAAVVLALCEAGNAALGTDGALSGLLDVVGRLAVAAAIGIAVLRHRLYDVDRAISRGLAYGWLAVLVTGIYVLLVVGVGSALGHPAGPDLLLSLVATIVVALVSLPLRSRLQEAANRLVYGRRQAPYDSLAGFTRQLAERSQDGNPLPGIAQALGEGLRARAAAVHLRDQADGAVVGCWPPGAPLPAVVPSGTAPVVHQGQDLGRLEVWTDDELTVAERRLLEDLAHQAGLVVRNAALSAELRRRLDQLRASRLRLVAAQDAERRRFERDLHDGAQQELLTVRMKLGSVERLAPGLDPEVADLLREVHESTAATLENIRRLSRGLNPPLLQSHGLVAALVAHARRLPLPTEVRGTGDRFAPDVETAVYFCCAEALQNVVKHAGASRAWVTVQDEPGHLCFEVGDDGRGLAAAPPPSGSGLQNMADRLEALGGRLDLRSDGSGTRVVGTVPLTRTGDTPERAGAGGR